MDKEGQDAGREAAAVASVGMRAKKISVPFGRARTFYFARVACAAQRKRSTPLVPLRGGPGPARAPRAGGSVSFGGRGLEMAGDFGGKG